MYQTGGTIKETLDSIQQSKFVLPAIQREFVWKTCITRESEHSSPERRSLAIFPTPGGKRPGSESMVK